MGPGTGGHGAPPSAGDDLEDLRTLKARYFRLLDTKAWDELAGLFTGDAVVDTTEAGGGVTVGPAAFVDGIRPLIDAAVTVHHGHMPELTLTSPTTATGLWAMEDELWWPDGGPLRHVHGWGHYHETYERGPDGWRIASMRLTRLHTVAE